MLIQRMGFLLPVFVLTLGIGASPRQVHPAPPASKKTTAISKLDDALDSYRLQNFELALSKLSWILKSDPNNINATFWLGATQFKIGNLDAAERTLKRMLERDPSSAKGYVWLGHIEEARGSWTKALSRYRKATAVDRNNSDASRNYNRVSQLLNGSIRAGKQLLEQGNPAAAAQRLEGAAALARDSVKVQFLYGRALATSGQLDRATKVYNHIQTLQPNSADASYWLAQITEKRGDIDKAAQQYAATLRAHPGHVATQKRLRELGTKTRAILVKATVKQRVNTLRPNIQLINKTNDTLSVTLGKGKHRLKPDATQNIPAGPTLYSYHASIDEVTITASGSLFIWSGTTTTLTFGLGSPEDLVTSPTDVTFSSEKHDATALKVLNRTSEIATIRIGDKAITIPPDKSAMIHVGSAEWKYMLEIGAAHKLNGKASLHPNKLTTWNLKVTR